MGDIRLLLLLHIPEAILVVFVSTYLFSIKAKIRDILLVGCVQGLLVYLVREIYINYKIPFGTHTFVTLLTLILLIRYIIKIDWGISIISIVSVESLVLIGASFPLKLSDFFNIPIEKQFHNPLLFASFGLTENIVVVFVGLICVLTGFKFKNILTETNKGFVNVFIFVILQAFFNIYLSVYNQYYRESNLFEITNTVLIWVNIIIAFITIYIVVSLFKLMKVAKQKEMELIIQKNNEHLVESLRMLRHDFNNHITVLNGLIQLGKQEDAKKYIKSLATETRSFNKLTSLKQQDLVAFFINKMRQAEDNGIEMKFNIESNLYNFFISVDKISKISGNIIDNAFYKLKNEEQTERRVLVEITEDLENYYFTVIDNGRLVPDDITQRLFERGFTTKGDDGSGRGLYIVKTAVDQMNGKLYFEQSLEQGVRFICAFPISKIE